MGGERDGERSVGRGVHIKDMAISKSNSNDNSNGNSYFNSDPNRLCES